MKKITYSDIIMREKRRRKVNEAGVELKKSCRLMYDRFEKGKSLNDALDFLHECAKSIETSETWFPELNECAVQYPGIRSSFSSFILPYVKDVKLEQSTNSNLDISWAEELRRNQLCDRISENHQRIIKKLDVDTYLNEHHFNSDPRVVADICCEAVSGFKQLDLKAKINIAIEEYSCQIQKREMSHDEAAMVDRIVRYFLVESDVKTEDLLGLADSLNNNVMIDFKPIKTSEAADNFYLGGKTVKALFEVYEMNHDLDEYLNLIESVLLGYKGNDMESLQKIFHTGVPKVLEYEFSKSECPLGKRNLEKLMDKLRGEYDFTMNYLHEFPAVASEGGLDRRIVANFTDFNKALREAMIRTERKLDIVYPRYNYKNITNEGVINTIKTATTTAKSVKKVADIVKGVSKVKDFIFRSGVATTIAAKLGLRKGKEKSKGSLLKEDLMLQECVTPEGRIDVLVETVYTEDKSITSEVQEYCNTLCHQINDSILYGLNEYCYYVALENSVEFHLASKEAVELNEEEYDMYIEHSIDDNDMESIYEMMYYSALDENRIVTEAEEISDFFLEEEEALDEFGYFLEIASFATMDKDVVTTVFEKLKNYAENPGDLQIKFGYQVENYQPAQDIDPSIVMESIDYIYYMVNESKEERQKRREEKQQAKQARLDEKEKQKQERKDLKLKEKMEKKELKHQKKIDKYESKDAPDFHGMKLFLMGLKEKAKKLSSKEQRLCNNLDAGYNRLVRSMRQALISDRREAIIKGSVIPSFSKSIKMGIAIAGTYAINPLGPLITAIGAFAISKRLTKKERVLLLDDIDIELQILDKEIMNAENRGQMKKLRVLMKEKKNLQRQYQRIKYNIRIGKDIIPGRSSE